MLRRTVGAGSFGTGKNYSSNDCSEFWFWLAGLVKGGGSKAKKIHSNEVQTHGLQPGRLNCFYRSCRDIGPPQCAVSAAMQWVPAWHHQQQEGWVGNNPGCMGARLKANLHHNSVQPFLSTTFVVRHGTAIQILWKRGRQQMGVHGHMIVVVCGAGNWGM